MSFGANPNDVSVMKTYADAVRWELLVKPIRGRAEECKPLGARNKSHANIRKENQDIVVRLYRTDIVRYKPDGTIIVNQGGFESMTTRKYLNAILPMWFGTHQNMTFTYRGIDGGGYHLLHANGENVFKPIPNKPNNVSFPSDLHFVNPRPCIVHIKDRTKSKRVRARYAPFIRYVKNVTKLMGGRIEIKERPALNYHTVPNVLPFALSKEPEDQYKALAWFAWVGCWNVGRADVLAQFENAIMRHHRDEMFDTCVLPRGELKHDKFAGLFYGA
jgi:hypothetical protein